jgi:single-strand DNA-binding protein
VSTFRVAVTRSYTNPQGEREADFIDIVAWRQNAEFAANYLGKGRLVAVEGRLQVRSFTDSQGVRRRTAEVVCDNLKALGRPREAGEGGSDAAAPHGPAAGGVDEVPAYDDPFQDE